MSLRNKFIFAVVGAVGTAFVASRAKEYFDLKRIEKDGRERISAAIQDLGDPDEHLRRICEKLAALKDSGITFPVPGSDTVYVSPSAQPTAH